MERLCAATSHLRRLHELHSQRAGHYVGDVSEQEVTHNVRQLYPVRYRRQHELFRCPLEQPSHRRPLVTGIARHQSHPCSNTAHFHLRRLFLGKQSRRIAGPQRFRHQPILRWTRLHLGTRMPDRRWKRMGYLGQRQRRNGQEPESPAVRWRTRGITSSSKCNGLPAISCCISQSR